MGLLIHSKEFKLFDEYTREHLKLCGEEIEYWYVDIIENKYDAVYGEHMPKRYTYRGGYKLLSVIKYNPPSITIEVGGSVYTLDCECYLARADFDEINIIPKPGDLVRIFSSNSPYFPSDVVFDGRGVYYSVIQTGDFGHIHNSDKFTWYKLDLQRKTDILPDLFVRTDNE